MSRNKRNEPGARDGALLFVLALVAGLANWRFLGGDPFLSYPIIDAAEYLAEARAILAGLPYWQSVPIHGPVYPLFLVPFLALFRSPLGPIYLAQILLTGCAALLVRSAGVRLGGRRVGNVAAALVAVAPPMLYFQVQVLPVIFQVFLHAGMLRLLVEKRSAPALAGAGFAAGLSYLTHPGAGLALGAITIFVLARTRPLRRGAFFALALVLPLVPVSLLDLRAGEGPLPVTGNAGLNLYVGNGPGSDGTPHVRPGYEWERLTAMPLLAGIEGSGAESRFFLERVGEEARSSPGAFARRLAAKALLFATGFPIDASQDPAYFRERSALLRLFLFDAGVLVPAAAGFLVVRAAWTGLWPLAGLGLLGYWLGAAATVFAVRYRAPAWPFLALLAAGGAVTLPRLPRRTAARAVVVALGLLLVAQIDPFGYRGKDPVRVDYQLGRLSFDRGDRDEARRRFLSLWERTGDPDAANALGAVAMAARGGEEEAGAWFRRAVAAAPDYADAHFNLGLWWIRRGRPDEGEREIDEAIRLAPGHAPALYTKGILLEGRGDAAHAETCYREALRRDPTRADAWNALGVLLAKGGRAPEAEACFRRALRLDPNSAETKANLERIRGAAR